MIGRCILKKQAQVWRGDEAGDVDRYINPLLPKTRSEMALPLISRGEVIGAMTFQSERPGDFTSEDIAVLQTMADQVANALENARLLEESRRRAAQESLLSQASARFSQSLNVDAVLQMAVRELGQLAGVSEVSVQLSSESPFNFQAPPSGKGNQ
jgi:GAF domain-containing protein